MAATSDSTPGSYIGARLPRPDGPPKLSGEAQYAADLSLPGMLHVRLLLSPYAHARIVGVKSAGGFRAAYDPFAAAVFYVDTPGPADSDLTRLPFRKIDRPLWPFDPDLDEPWEGAGR